MREPAKPTDTSIAPLQRHKVGEEGSQMHYEATNPERVSDKVKECRFFLVLMADYEKTETDKFLFCVSAFLSAFRSIVYRLLGTVRERNGEAAKKALWDRLRSHRDIYFLKDATDLEVHGDGVRIWRRYTVNVSYAMPERWAARFGPSTDRFHSRFESRYQHVSSSRQVTDWQFDGRPANVIELCHDTLEEMGQIIRQSIPLVAGS